MNTQPALMDNFNLDELPVSPPPPAGPAADDGGYEKAVEAIYRAQRAVVKIGGGARAASAEILEFVDLADAVAITSPVLPGIIPFDHPRNMTVGGSKGTLSGNYAGENADLLVALGTRFVCQSDSSRTAYPNLARVININADIETAGHYGKSIMLVGDVAATLRQLNRRLRVTAKSGSSDSAWLKACKQKRREWDTFRQERYAAHTLRDSVWGREVLTQPVAIKVATDWARAHKVVSFFDAGDVQANGFQIVEDSELGLTFSDTGASYMGFAVSALLATAIAGRRFYGLALTGDGSFTMNPQVLIDGSHHGAQGCILLLDNRRMGAISGLQSDQYGAVYGTSDSVEVDYVAWAQSVRGVAGFHGGYNIDSLKEALNGAIRHPGLSLLHVPVYWGPEELGGMGVFGRWNIGNWCADVQRRRHEIGL